MTQETVYQDINPTELHKVYGINCYQNAIGYKPITIHYNEAAGRLNYLTLCPGNMAQILNDDFSRNAGYEISSHMMKKILISQCKEDQLEELETRTLSTPINVPEGKRLIALFYSNERKDFDFQYYDQKSRMWKNKTPTEDYTEREDMPRFLAGGYVFTRFFVAPENIEPKGVPKGNSHHFREEDITLNLPATIQPWERGPCFQKTEGGFYLKKTEKVYASPDLSFARS